MRVLLAVAAVLSVAVAAAAAEDTPGSDAAKGGVATEKAAEAKEDEKEKAREQSEARVKSFLAEVKTQLANSQKEAEAAAGGTSGDTRGKGRGKESPWGIPRPDPKDGPVIPVVWTQQKEPDLSPQATGKGKTGGRPIAFRDLVIEKTGERMFTRFMDKIRHPNRYNRRMSVFDASSPILRDPMTLSEGINTKKKSSLFDIQLKTNKMKIHGFHKLKLTYIRVIRHYGLRDIKVNLRLGADMKISGHYTLKGQALSFLPVTGDGDFGIDLSGCSLSAISFLHLDKDEKTGEERLVIKELEVSVDYAQVKFDFKNLMGGGVVGSAANMVINTMGEAIVSSQKKKIANLLKDTFREQVSMFI